MLEPGSRDASVREAKQFVREVVRNDWEFEPGVPSPSSADGTLCHNREVCEWRVREFDTPTSELEPQTSDSERENEPPTVLTTSGDAGIERRRKRRRQMDEEMAWNEGLRLWMARRDAWCGAKTRRQIRAENKKRQGADVHADTADQLTGVEPGASGTTLSGTDSSVTPGQGGISTTELAAAQTETSLPVADREKSEEIQHRVDMTSGQQGDVEEGLSTAPEEGVKRKVSSETSITEPDQKAPAIDATHLGALPPVEDQTEEENVEEELDEPLCPVAPPFISNENAVRATINPAIYPSIYTKVVVQGMTPTIPVNLAHLTKAMVQGWKADGQWPPKPAATSIVLADDASVPKKPEQSEDAPQSRRKNSITNAMKKVLHFGTHPFHRRGSGSHDAGNGAGASGPTA
ncbi:hypothetical protein N7535_002098 [Penicillium sp. DV-2018c]|nr:hypothetical protein N7461_004658 [Penicillium sp. DV-2018c]KAJ5583478.1 hypothetical protein N7535_002098 [Penicillium sp. DV-2018c]